MALDTVPATPYLAFDNAITFHNVEVRVTVRELRVGLLGAGALGAVHAANVAAIGGCHLAAVASTTITDVVADLAHRAGADIVTPAQLIDPTRVDALIVATPTDTHCAYALRAIEAGLPLFLEKPVTRTVAEAEQVQQLSGAKGVKVAVGHVVRYFPEYAAAHRAVVSGRLGSVQTARLRRFNAAPGEPGSWFAEPSRSGGVLLDMAIHDIDWSLWTFGPVDRVYCRRAGQGTGEVVSVTLVHRHGAISYLEASWRERGFSTHLEVTGTSAMFQVDGSGSAGFDAFALDPRRIPYLPPSIDTPGADDPYRLEIIAAFNWFRGGPTPLATVDEACAALRVAAAAEWSAASGAAVEVAA